MHRVCLLSLAALAMLASPALAETDSKDPDILAPRFDLTIWSIIIFVILFLVLRKFAWGPILEGLTKRERNIEGAIEEAKRVREEMAKLKSDFDRQIAEANQQIPKLMEEARRAAEQLKEEMRAQGMADIQAERQRLRREIETARDQAIQEIWGQAANLATLISARAIRRTLSAEDQRRLNDEALAEMHEFSQRNQKTATALAGEWVRKGGGKA